MTRCYPILILVPHGGVTVPEEFTRFATVKDFDLLYCADTSANEIFNFGKKVTATVSTKISRLFVDVDRYHLELPAVTPDGVIKKKMSNGKYVFKRGVIPDEIAITNILKRYYFPYHRKIEDILETKKISLILDCHTMMPVGPPDAPDADRPRPLITVGNNCKEEGNTRKTCSDGLAAAFLDNMKRQFSDEKVTVAERFTINSPALTGHIMTQYGTARVPLIRLSLSRTFFFNEKYFSYEYLTVDELRIAELRKRVWDGIKRFFNKEL